MLKKILAAVLWEWVPQHSFAVCSQKKFTLRSASYNTLLELLYIKFQSTNSRLNSNPKNVFLELDVVRSIFHCLWSQSICSVSPSYFWTIVWWHHRPYHIWSPTANLCKTCFEAIGFSDLITAFLVCLSSRHSPSFFMTFCPLNTDLPLSGNKMSPTPSPKALTFSCRQFIFFNSTDTENFTLVCKEDVSIPVLSLWKEVSRCPWDLITEEKASRRLWMFTVAVLTISAADPWTVVFTACRSA